MLSSAANLPGFVVFDRFVDSKLSPCQLPSPNLSATRALSPASSILRGRFRLASLPSSAPTVAEANEGRRGASEVNAAGGGATPVGGAATTERALSAAALAALHRA